MPRLQDGVGTVRRAPRQCPASPTPARQRRLAAPARLPTASRAPPSPRLSPRPRRPRPDRLADCATVPTTSPQSRSELTRQRCAAVRRSRTGEPLLLSRFPRTDAVSSPARQAAQPRVAPPCAAPAEAKSGRAPRGSGPRPTWPWAAHAGRAQWQPVKFFYFLIYSIRCKFKNLCRIHLNSKNYETNFVGRV
jgi:hypothetical protein